MKINFSFPLELIDLFQVLSKLTNEVYLVGGSLRNFLLQVEIKDYDLAINYDIKSVATHLEKENIKVLYTGIDFGGITAIYRSKVFEITEFRGEGEYLDNRHPSSITRVDNMIDDASRRDFTINALYLSSDKELYDFFNGIEDLNNRVLRSVGNPIERFKEDAIRLIRALRFASNYDLEIEPVTRSAIKYCSKLIQNVSKERIQKEIDGLLLSSNLKRSVLLLVETNLYKFIFPTVTDKLYIPKDQRIISKLSLSARYAIIFKNAKLETMKEVLSKLRYSNAQKNEILILLEALNYQVNTDIDRKFLLSKLGDLTTQFIYLLAIESIEEARRFNSLKRKVLEQNIPYKFEDLALTGDDIISSLSLTNKSIGEAKLKAYFYILEYPEKNNKIDLLSYLREVYR